MDNVSLWTCDILWRRSCQVAIAVFLLIMYIQDALVFLRLLVPPFSSPWQHLSPRSLRSLNLMCYWNRVVTRNARDGQTNLIIPAAVELAWAQLWNNPHILCSAESAKRHWRQESKSWELIQKVMHVPARSREIGVEAVRFCQCTNVRHAICCVFVSSLLFVLICGFVFNIPLHHLCHVLFFC